MNKAVREHGDVPVVYKDKITGVPLFDITARLSNQVKISPLLVTEPLHFGHAFNLANITQHYQGYPGIANIERTYTNANRTPTPVANGHLTYTFDLPNTAASEELRFNSFIKSHSDPYISGVSEACVAYLAKYGYTAHAGKSTNPHDLLAALRLLSDLDMAYEACLPLYHPETFQLVPSRPLYEVCSSGRLIQDGVTFLHANRPLWTIPDRPKHEHFQTIMSGLRNNAYTALHNCTCQIDPQLQQLCAHALESVIISIDVIYHELVRNAYYHALATNYFRSRNALNPSNPLPAFASFHVFNPDISTAQIGIEGDYCGRWFRTGKMINYFPDAEGYTSYVHEDIYPELYRENAISIPLDTSAYPNRTADKLYIHITVTKRFQLNGEDYVTCRFDAATTPDIDASPVLSRADFIIEKSHKLEPNPDPHKSYYIEGKDGKKRLCRLIAGKLKATDLYDTTSWGPSSWYHYHADASLYNVEVPLTLLADIQRKISAWKTLDVESVQDLVTVTALNAPHLDMTTEIFPIIQEALKEHLHIRARITCLTGSHSMRLLKSFKSNNMHQNACFLRKLIIDMIGTHIDSEYISQTSDERLYTIWEMLFGASQ